MSVPFSPPVLSRVIFYVCSNLEAVVDEEGFEQRFQHFNAGADGVAHELSHLQRVQHLGENKGVLF